MPDGLYTFADATRTPRGDGNYLAIPITNTSFHDATCTPHGGGNMPFLICTVIYLGSAATRTPTSQCSRETR